MAIDAGTVYYEVEADTRKLTDSVKPVDDSLKKIGKTAATTDGQVDKMGTKMTATASAVRNLGKEASATSGTLGNMSGVLAGLVTLQSIKSLVTLADSWTNLQNRLRLVTSSQEELNQATQAVYEIAQGTSQSIDTVAEVYQRFAQNAGKLGLSLAQVAEVTETVSKAVAVSGASAGAAQAALTQFGQALASGTLRGEELNSIMEQTPALAAAIAKGLGITTGELRDMGAAGKITAASLVDALTAARDSVDAQFATRIKTVGAAFTELQNATMRFVGEASNATSASTTLANAISAVATNLDSVVAVLVSVGAGALAAYIARMGIASVTTIQASLAARAAAVEEINLAKANLAAATAASTNAARNAQLTGSHTAAAAAATAQAAAVTRLAVAQRAAATIGGTMLALLGGPVGIAALAVTAATSMLMFSDNTGKATSRLVDMSQPLDSVIKKFTALSASQRELTLSMAKKDIADNVKNLDSAFDTFSKGSLLDGTKALASFRALSADKFAALVEGAKNGNTSLQYMDKTMVEMVKDYAALTGRSEEWTNDQIRLTSEVTKAVGQLQNAQQQSKALTDANNGLAGANRNAAAGQRELNNALSGSNTEAGKYLKALQDRVAGLQDGSSQVKQAERFLQDHAEASQLDRVAIMSAAQAHDYLAKQAAATKSGLSDSASAAKENAKAIAKMREELAEAKLAGDELAITRAKNQLNVFAKPSEVATVTQLAKAMLELNDQAARKAGFVETEKQIGQMSVALALANLKGRELATTQAQLALNEYATPEQIERVQAIAGATYDLAKAEELRKKIAGEDEGQAAKTTKDYIRGDVDPLKGGEFDQQQARYAAEAKAEEQRYTDQINRFKEAQAAKIEVQGGYFVLEEQLLQEHNDRMAQIEQAKTTLMLKTGEQGFGALADGLKAAFGEQNALYKAAFVAQKAFAIAQSVIAIQQGIALAAANPWPLNLGAMASVAAATAGLVANIASVTMGSGKQYGGGVGPGKMHRVNENGAPELLNMANGNQFLIPNGRGQVVSSADAAAGSGGGGSSITVNLIENAAKGGQVEPVAGSDGNSVNVFVADIRGRGKMAQAMEETYALKRQGT